ncbi:PepSY domain-containing protein [Metabacillus sp. RGM 3146]|uniref:PepSY domain-containing protein n=1 Tax=Metabacillus sp. RGM 3146 TaxID=3401092 RepID=UPI003B9916A6
MHFSGKLTAAALASLFCTLPFTASTAAIYPAPLVNSQSSAISMDQAKKIALKETPGKIIKIALKTDEDGRLVYKVIVLSNGAEHKIKIDARTGQVLKVKNKD